MNKKEEISKKLANLNIEKLAQKTAKKAGQKLWNWTNAIKSFCTETEAKKASADANYQKQIMKKVRRKLRTDQYNLALGYLSAVKKVTVANNATNQQALSNAIKNFREFNSKYLVDAKASFTNVSEENEKETFEFLKLAYESLELEK